jgi:hypothetical protein
MRAAALLQTADKGACEIDGGRVAALVIRVYRKMFPRVILRVALHVCFPVCVLESRCAPLKDLSSGSASDAPSHFHVSRFRSSANLHIRPDASDTGNRYRRQYASSNSHNAHTCIPPWNEVLVVFVWSANGWYFASRCSCLYPHHTKYCGAAPVDSSLQGRTGRRHSKTSVGIA